MSSTTTDTPVDTEARRPPRRGWTRVGVGRLVAIALIVVFFGFPIYWMFVGSIQPPTELLSQGLIPTHLTLANYTRLLQTDFSRYMINSLIVASSTTAITTSLSATSGYALARLPIPGRKWLARSVLLSYMFPAMALAVPMYILWQAGGLLDTRIGLILAHVAITLPLGIWLMWQFFQTIPISLEEAAQTMGASTLRTFRDVALPIARPGLVAIAIFAFAISWEDFTFSFLLTSDPSVKTLPFGVLDFVGTDRVVWSLVQSAAVIVAVPGILIVLLFQRYLIRGIAAGSVKG